MPGKISGDGGENTIGTRFQNYQDSGKKVPEPMHAPALTEIRDIRCPSSTACGNARMNPVGCKLQTPASQGPVEDTVLPCPLLCNMLWLLNQIRAGFS